MPVTGPMLKQEAQRSTMKHNRDEFLASNGWLHSFCKRHQIKHANLHGESADVNQEAVED